MTPLVASVTFPSPELITWLTATSCDFDCNTFTASQDHIHFLEGFHAQEKQHNIVIRLVVMYRVAYM